MGEGYRVANFEEEICDLDPRGEVRPPRNALDSVSVFARWRALVVCLALASACVPSDFVFAGDEASDAGIVEGGTSILDSGESETAPTHDAGDATGKPDALDVPCDSGKAC